MVYDKFTDFLSVDLSDPFVVEDISILSKSTAIVDKRNKCFIDTVKSKQLRDTYEVLFH